jgi:hypothetical protein
MLVDDDELGPTLIRRPGSRRKKPAASRTAKTAAPEGPPARVRGMLGEGRSDQFPIFGRWAPPARPSQIQEFDLRDAQMLLDEPTIPGDHGGHAAGGSKLDTFPPGWDATRVRAWVAALIDSPTNGYPGRGPGRAGGFSLFGEHDGVVGVLRIKDDWGSWIVLTAYPFDRIRWQYELDAHDALG